MTEGDVYDYVDESSADVMTRFDSHGEGRLRRIRLMRGQARIRRDPADMGRETTYNGIIIPATAHNPRETKIHRGTIVQLGPPGHKRARKDSPIVPWDCSVGDEVFFVFAVWLESRRHTEDENVVIIAQSEIVAVIS